MVMGSSFCGQGTLTKAVYIGEKAWYVSVLRNVQSVMKCMLGVQFCFNLSLYSVMECMLGVQFCFNLSFAIILQ